MNNAKTWKRSAGGAGLVAAGLIAGGILAGTLSANAADTGTGTGTQTATAPESSSSASIDPSRPQRSDEQLLTGDTKASVEKAVLAKYAGATIERTETDSDGVYESHIVTSDGQHVIVQVDKSFTVTGTQTGGGPGGGHHGPDGDADDSGTAQSGGATQSDGA
jgi:hypothetical protein